MSDTVKVITRTLRRIFTTPQTYVLLAICLATYFTLTPFLTNTFQTPNNRIYLGVENNPNAYFHYLKVSLDGQNLSSDKFTAKFNQSPLDDKYYLLKSRVDALLAFSNFSSYHVGRLKFNLLFFIFGYLILAHIFIKRNPRIVLFTALFLLLFPLITLLTNYSSKIFFLSYLAYPHIAFTRLAVIFALFLILKIFSKFLKIPLKSSFNLSKTPTTVIVVVMTLIGLFLNSKIAVVNKQPKDSLYYPSKDFYEGVGYLRDNAAQGEKVFAFSRASIITETFAGVPTVLGLPRQQAGLPENNPQYTQTESKLAADLQTIFDNPLTLKKLQSDGVVYWFLGPEEKPIAGTDFFRLNPKEVFKNKEVSVYKLEPPAK